MTVTTAKWTLDDYHRMIEVGGDRIRLPNSFKLTGFARYTYFQHSGTSLRKQG